MIACNILLLSFSLLIAENYVVAPEPNEEVQCPCPIAYYDRCVKREYCAYGINDRGDVYFNGEKDIMNLTNAVLKRKTEINTEDDVVVNLYNPFRGPMAIFYYGCRECEDLKKIDHLTVPKLRIFLLSIYNQRMKHNIRYSQSDFNSTSFAFEDPQPRPIIDVRPFWKNRLILNQTCARKSLEFTQKHFIPAFLTQDICILDFRYVNKTAEHNFFKSEREIIYSMTLSNITLYQYQILPNSTTDLSEDIYHGKIEMCKLSFYISLGEYSMRFFCLCEDGDCTLKIMNKDPRQYCPTKMRTYLGTSLVYNYIYQESEYMAVDDFFIKNGCQENCDTQNATYRSCMFIWRSEPGVFDAYFYVMNETLPKGYSFYTNVVPCLYNNESSVGKLGYVMTKLYDEDTFVIRTAFLELMLNHITLKDDIVPVGANCQNEGPFSDPLFSSFYGANSSSAFPCYKYVDIYSKRQVYPLMGVNMSPLQTAKGKECYFYIVRIDTNYRNSNSCGHLADYGYLVPIVTVSACPEGIEPDEKEVQIIKRMNAACPTTIPGTKKWNYVASASYIDYFHMCGQFLRGIKLQNGIYVPDEVILREITHQDLEENGMIKNGSGTYHGCGFNSTTITTLCTCSAPLGGCNNLYTVGRVHMLRFLPNMV